MSNVTVAVQPPLGSRGTVVTPPAQDICAEAVCIPNPHNTILKDSMIYLLKDSLAFIIVNKLVLVKKIHPSPSCIHDEIILTAKEMYDIIERSDSVDGMPTVRGISRREHHFGCFK